MTLRDFRMLHTHIPFEGCYNKGSGKWGDFTSFIQNCLFSSHILKILTAFYSLTMIKILNIPCNTRHVLHKCSQEGDYYYYFLYVCMYFFILFFQKLKGLEKILYSGNKKISRIHGVSKWCFSKRGENKL